MREHDPILCTAEVASESATEAIRRLAWIAQHEPDAAALCVEYAKLQARVAVIVERVRFGR